MALRDLITQRAAIAEQQIEKIVADYVGYDVDEKVVVHRPTFAKLSNKGKVLVHLVALQGWQYVTEDDVPAGASPADLEKDLHIAGGTLRPTLKDLKDRHLINVSGHKYSVSPAALENIKSEIKGQGDGETATRTPRPRTRRKSRASTAKTDAQTGAKKRGNKARAVNKAAKFDAWIKKGFFDKPKTLKEVHARFHKEGEIVAMTSVPKYLLAAIRDDRLEREQTEIGDKKVWAYKTKNAHPPENG